MINRFKQGLTGASAAAPIWAFFMEKALKGRNKIKFSIPEGIKFEKVDVHSGTFVDDQSLESTNVALKEEIVILPRDLKSYDISKEQEPK